MKRSSFMAALIVVLFCSSVFALTGRQIIGKARDLPSAKTSKTTILMKIHKGGGIVEKKFKMIGKKYPGKKTKNLVTFLKPTSLKLLSHTEAGEDSNQWLRMSSGRVKRIASSDKGKAFVGSHFNFEDMGQGESIDDFSYSNIGLAKVEGVNCFKIEAKKKAGSAVYDKSVIYIRKSDFFVLRVDLFKKGALHKYLINYQIKKVNGILTPHKVVMYMNDKSGKTELYIKSIKYNMNISDSQFNKESLR